MGRSQGPVAFPALEGNVTGPLNYTFIIFLVPWQRTAGRTVRKVIRSWGHWDIYVSNK